MGFIGKQPAKAAITSSDITDGIVTADKLASDSVTTAKIADNGVTTAKINADAVTDAKIADDVVGSEHLTAGEGDTTALGADAVTAAKIADDAISEEHLDATVITGMTELAATPADTDEFLISDAGTLKRIDYSHIKGGGIENAQMWYATNSTQQSSTHTKYTSWAAHDGSQIGSIGSGLTVSSGDIQFPSTGIWLLKSRFTYYVGSSGQVRYILSQIRVSTDSGSNYTLVDESINNLVNVNSSNNDYTITRNEYLLDVTNASTTRAAFYVAAEDNSVYLESYNKATIFQAIRLGDT